MRKGIEMGKLFLWIIILNVAVFSMTKEKDVISKLNSLNPEQKKRAIIKLYYADKESIEALIENISNCDKIKGFSLQSPASSRFTKQELRNGILSAYVIELIFSKEGIFDSKILDLNCPLLLGCDNRNYIFFQGELIRKDGKELTEKDLAKVKLLYKYWWDKNKEKTILQLRNEYKKGNTPLGNSANAQFHWE